LSTSSFSQTFLAKSFGQQVLGSNFQNKEGSELSERPELDYNRCNLDLEWRPHSVSHPGAPFGSEQQPG
jgi:hypothetical protein